MNTRLLFILKRRDAPYTDEKSYGQGGMSSGLLNSASFIVRMLTDAGVDTKLVQVQDNNCIDREVNEYKPTHVIIEAYWVVPEKFEVLTKLHPNVKWIIRNHSEIPFLATEGIGIDWSMKYLKYPNVYISANSDRALHEMRTMARASHGVKYNSRVLYLPNYYSTNVKSVKKDNSNKDTIDIGCFGAIRPLKNQLIQAVAAIKFAERIGKKLRFHINATRVEGGGNNTLRNIQALFHHADERYQLVEHTWMPHDDFVALCSTMDLSLCVSFTETFCIVAADCVNMGVPIVGSPDIRWASSLSKADPTSSEDMLCKMTTAWRYRKTNVIQTLNKLGLRQNIKEAREQWLRLFAR